MMTYTGKMIDAFDIDPGKVCIEDIAHHLALTLRFGGGTKWPYSVARHCVIMAGEGMPGDPLTNLLHDAWEAYGGDHIYGVKDRLLIMSNHRRFPIPIYDYEQNGMKRIYGGLGLPQPTESYKMADMIMLSAESQVLLKDPWGFSCSMSGEPPSRRATESFQDMGMPFICKIPKGYDWEEDEELFLGKYNELTLVRKEY